MASVTKKADNAHTYERYNKSHDLAYAALSGSNINNLFLTFYAVFHLMFGH